MKRILLIATGGTIASVEGETGLEPRIGAERLLSFVPEVAPLCAIDTLSPINLDSTQIQPEHWVLLAGLIREQYDRYDGFVICHGTDTMAYTAAALSYLVQGSPKPIVLTGSQYPIDAANTDGRMNLADALAYACAPGSQAVSLCFGGRVIAGTRARKTRTKSFDAFASIDFPELAKIRRGRILRYLPPRTLTGPVFYDRINPRVMLIKLIPGMPGVILEDLADRFDALVIESFGVGGLPSGGRSDFLERMARLHEAGKVVVMATQVMHEGSDLGVYRVGRLVAERYHLIESGDMTLEATVTKLMWLLGRGLEGEDLRRAFAAPVNYDNLDILE